MATLFLLSNLRTGGSEIKSARVVSDLSERGVDVHLGWLGGPGALRSRLNSRVPSVCFERDAPFSWRALRSLASYVAEHRIERIVCINLYPVIYAAGVGLLGHGQAPRYVAAINSTILLSRKERLQMLVYAPLLRRAEQIVFGCEAQRDLWIRCYGLPRRRTSVIYNGVDSHWFSPETHPEGAAEHRAKYGLVSSDFVVGAVGVLRPEKNFGHLIDAIAELRKRGVQAKGLIAGDGPERQSLERHAAEAGVAPHVIFLGELRDVRPALAASDIVVLPSAETFSNAALEAMAMAKPVLLSSVGGAAEMITEGVNGFLFPLGDVSGLTAILEKVSASRNRLASMGMIARESVIQTFTVDRMLAKYERLCRTLA